jgi:hypothetical protein
MRTAQGTLEEQMGMMWVFVGPKGADAHGEEDDEPAKRPGLFGLPSFLGGKKL